MKRVLGLTGILWGALALCGHAAEAPPALRVREAEAVRKACAVVEALGGRDEARRALEEAAGWSRGWRDPELRFSYGQRTDQGAVLPGSLPNDREQTAAALRVFFPNPMAQRAQRGVYRAQAYYVDSLAEESLWDLKIRVRKVYRNWLYRQQDLEAAERQMAVWDVARDELRRQIDLGAETVDTLLQAETDCLRAVGARDDARSAYTQVRALMAALIRAEPNVDLQPEPDNWAPGEVLTSRSFSAWLDRAWTTHPARAPLQARYEEARAEEQVQRAARLPWLRYVQGAYGNTTGDLDAENWDVRAAIEVPLFSWIGNPGAEEAVEAAEWLLREQVLRHKLEVELRRVYGEGLGLWQALCDARADTGAAEQALREALAAADTLQINPLRRADAEDALLRRERRILELRYDFQQAVLKFEGLLGSRLQRLQPITLRP